jgi:hypothetical protein
MDNYGFAGVSFLHFHISYRALARPGVMHPNS